MFFPEPSSSINGFLDSEKFLNYILAFNFNSRALSPANKTR
jgi:hypothetical protein